MTKVKSSGVYIITNTANGNRYIGSSIDICRRWKEHIRELRGGVHINTHLQRAWDMYGENNFEFSILLLCSDSDTILNEQKYLDDLQPEYNIAIYAAASLLGKSFTEEHRRKISEARKGKPLPEETRAKMREAHSGVNNAMYGKHHTEDTKHKLSDLVKGKPSKCAGYKHTDEARANMREAQKNRPPTSEETRKKMSEAHKGSRRSDETKLKMREAWVRRRNNGSEAG